MASQSIDELKIEVDYEASQASTGVKDLAETLKNLSSVTNGLSSKLGSISKNLTSFNQTMANTSAGSYKNSIEQIVQALTPLQNLERAKLTSFINQLTKLKDVNNQLDPKTIDEFAQKIERLSNALTPLASKMNAVSSGFAKLPTYISSTNNRLAKYNVTAKATSSINKKLNLAAVGATFTRLSRIIAGFVAKSNAYVENLNLFRVAMGESADTADRWINTVSSALGLDPSEMQRYMGVFQMIASGFGLSAENAYKMSKNLTQLTYDISSFYNINIDQAAQKVQSAIARRTRTC